MPGGNVQVPGSSAQPGHSSEDGNQRTSSPWLLSGGRLFTHGTSIGDYIFWYPEVPEDMMEQLFSCLKGHTGPPVNQNKSQITFIVTSPQHKCLGEWNSYERAPDSAEKQQTIYLWTDSAKNKKQTIYLWTDSAKKKTTNNLHMDRQCKKNSKQFTYGQTVQKDNKQFTYGQTVQKNSKQFTYGQTVQKNCTGAFTVLQTVQKKTITAIYIWTDSAKKQQQFTYGQYIFTDCTEDNVQNTHTYTQYA